MRALLLAVAICTALVGCGSSDEDEAGTRVRAYLNAFADGDGERTCQQLTDEGARSFVDAITAQVPKLSASSCEEAVEAVVDAGADTSVLRDVELTQVTVDGDTATVRAKGGTADAELVKTDAGWRIDGGIDF